MLHATDIFARSGKRGHIGPHAAWSIKTINGQGTMIDELVGILPRDIRNRDSPIVCVHFRWWQSIRLRGAPIWITSLTRSSKNCKPLCFHGYSLSSIPIFSGLIFSQSGWLDRCPALLFHRLLGSWVMCNNAAHIPPHHGIASSCAVEWCRSISWVPARPVVNCLDCRRKINKDLRCMYLPIILNS